MTDPGRPSGPRLPRPWVWVVVIVVWIAVVLVLGFALVVFCPQCVPFPRYSPGP